MGRAKTANTKKGNNLTRKLNGEVVKPCLYNGQHIGQGKFFAGMVNDRLVCDPDGKPYQFRDVGEVC